jgi:hypothetical protein
MTSSQVTVRDNPEAGSYDALIDDKVVGSIVYQPTAGRRMFRHTIVEPEYRGRGIGTQLVTGALDDVRAKGETITNYCEFVSKFLGTHPEYADLIDADHPGRV